MAITLRSTGSTVQVGPGVNTMEVTPPGTIVDGDLLVIFAYIDDNQTISDGEGDWTKDTQVTNGAAASDSAIAVFYKFASSESGNYTINRGGTTGFMCGVCVALAGVDGTTPVDATTTTNVDTVNSDTHNPTAITTVTNGAWVWSLVGGNQTDTSAKVQPSGYTLLTQTQNGDDFGVAYKEVAVAGSEDPGNWSGWGTTADTGSITFAVRPAASAGIAPQAFYHLRHHGAI